MATFNYNDSEHYGSKGNGSFFSLRKNHEVARVRFMYSGMEDIEGMSTHKVDVDDKERYVNCLRAYNEPINVCPFCAAQMKVYPKVFVKLYDVASDEVKIWDRGKTFFQKISSICARYSPLFQYEFEIERNGEPGDMKTTYDIFPVGEKDASLSFEDLPELPTILGGLVLDKSAEEMEYYLDYGTFESPEEGAQVSGGRSARRESSEPVQRRTPANRSGRDVY